MQASIAAGTSGHRGWNENGGGGGGVGGGDGAQSVWLLHQAKCSKWRGEAQSMICLIH